MTLCIDPHNANSRSNVNRPQNGGDQFSETKLQKNKPPVPYKSLIWRSKENLPINETERVIANGVDFLRNSLFN